MPARTDAGVPGRSARVWLVAALALLAVAFAGCVGPGLEPPAHDRAPGIPGSNDDRDAATSSGGSGGNGQSSSGAGGAGGQGGQGGLGTPTVTPGPDAGVVDPDPMTGDEDGGTR